MQHGSHCADGAFQKTGRQDTGQAAGRHLLPEQHGSVAKKREECRQREEHSGSGHQLVGAQPDFLETEQGVSHVEKRQRDQIGGQAETAEKQVGDLSAKASSQVVNLSFGGVAVPGDISGVIGEEGQQKKNADGAKRHSLQFFGQFIFFGFFHVSFGFRELK
jgi:hypothetical protein